MNQEKKVLVLKSKAAKPLSDDWKTWTPQQRADAMQRENGRFDHSAKYGRYGY